jgi:hypothetical protein
MLEDLTPESNKPYGCLVVERVREHPDTTEKDVEIVLKYMDDSDWGHYQLQNALRKKGIDVHKDSILRHRQRRCPCWMT